jgi:shikimate kinase
MSHVVLVGMMATGKSSAGRRVAETLGRPLIDSDDQIEELTERTVRQIWRDDGEPAFRRLESEVLEEALATSAEAVIAAAGGVVLDPSNRERLRAADARVVWLRARPDTLYERIRDAGDGHRPLLDDDPEGTLGRMCDERGSLYEEVATDVIDVDDLSLDEVVRRILAVVDT